MYLIHTDAANKMIRTHSSISEKTYKFVQVYFCPMCEAPKEKSSLIGLRLNSSQGSCPKLKEGIAISVRRCISCNLIFSSPLPIPSSLQDHYGIPPSDYWKDALGVEKDYFFSQIKKAKELIRFNSGMYALDIGAGVGKGMIALTSAGFDVYGFEPSIPFREKAIQVSGIDPKKLKLAMIETVEYPNEYFDFITFGAVLEHLYDPSTAIKKAVSWLKRDGVIHIEVPSSNWLISRLVNIYYKLIGVNYVTNISPMHSPFHLYEFTLQSFVLNGKISNYEVISYSYSVCALIHVPRFLHPLFRWYMAKTNTGMQLTVWLKRT